MSKPKCLNPLPLLGAGKSLAVHGRHEVDLDDLLGAQSLVGHETFDRVITVFPENKPHPDDATGAIKQNVARPHDEGMVRLFEVTLTETAESFLGPIGLSVPAGEKDRSLIEQLSSRPTCDVNGIWGGYTGEGSKTVIPAQASAKISFRLVSGQEPEKIRAAFRAFLRARLPADCRAEFIDHTGAPAIALDWDMPQLGAARRALTEEWGKDALLIGSDASIPICADFKRLLMQADRTQ